MPRAITATQSHLYFTIDQPVGRNAPNDHFDVLLVQFLLRIATSGNVDWPTGSEFYWGPDLDVGTRRPLLTRAAGAPANRLPLALPGMPDGTQISIDGDCGPQTIQFIEFFQQEMVKRGQKPAVDGQVKPWANTLTGTMELLNWALARSSWGGPRKWNLVSSPGFPQELYKYFYSPWIPFS